MINVVVTQNRERKNRHKYIKKGKTDGSKYGSH